MAAMVAILDFRSEQFYLFLMYKSHQCFQPSFKSIGLCSEEFSKKIDFRDGGHGSYFGFPISMILAFFDLQVTLMLPIKFQVSWTWFRRRSKKWIFKMAATAAIIDYPSEQF